MLSQLVPVALQVAAEVMREGGHLWVQKQFGALPAAAPQAVSAGETAPRPAEGCPYCAVYEKVWAAYGLLTHAERNPAVYQGVAAKKTQEALGVATARIGTSDLTDLKLHRGLMMLDMALSRPRSPEELTGKVAPLANDISELALNLADRYNTVTDRLDAALGLFDQRIIEHGEVIEGEVRHV